MKRGGSAGRSVLRLSYVSALVAAAMVAALAGFYERQSADVFRQRGRADVLDRLSLLRSELQGKIDANIQLVRGLVAVLGYAPDMDQAQFARLGTRLLAGQGEVRNIAAAPDLVVSLLHPVAGNEAVLGLDYRTLPDQLGATRMARELGTTIVAGPLDLVQGGRGFIARTPVFLDGERGRDFWGIVSTVIDADAFYRATELADPDLPLDVVLAGRDGTGREPFFGDPAVLTQDPVTSRVTLPFGAWEIAAVPKGGWQAPPVPWGARSLFALAGLMVVAPILGTARLVASRQSQFALLREREAELSRLSWRLEFALAASQVGVWDVDLATDRLLWDDRAKALFGYPDRTGFFGDADWSGALHPDDRDRAMAEAAAAVDGDGRFVTEYRIVRPDGAVRHIRDMAARYEGADGSRRLVGLVWDITADVERQAELNLRRLEAEAATVAKSRFLAAMSHEIRTPMSGVLGLLGLILEGPLSEEQRQRAATALASAQGLLGILNDILDFSKLEANQIRISEEEVAVRPLVGEVMDLMGAGAERKGLALTVEIAAAVPERIVTDPMRLRQVLVNLVSNATKFTDEGSVTVRVDYAADPTGDRLLVAVEDTGIGISEDQCGQVFQHFVQADASLTRRAGGTGLGLAISKQLVELMGGGIAVRSVPEMGSTFSFSIGTRAGGAAPAAPARQASAPQVAPPLRVLLAEDNSTNQYVIEAYMRAAGHAVKTVGNGLEAVAAARSGRFDVVLMDVQMPRMDGLTAARAIRALPGPASALPIIALTATAMSGDREDCIAAGMTDYLAKPIEVAALHAALARAAPSPQPRRSVG